MFNYLYYGFGFEDGGVCDILGIDFLFLEVEFSYVVMDSSLQVIDFYDGFKFQFYVWYWDFGDGVVSNSCYLQYSYVFLVLYEVCLMVINV